MLVLALAKSLAVELSVSSVRVLPHRLELRWGRPRLSMPVKLDPDKAAKRWAIAEAVVEAGPGTAILYADESRICLLPLVRAMWHWVGHQVRVPTPGSDEARAVSGALNIHTGDWGYLIREHMHYGCPARRGPGVLRRHDTRGGSHLGGCRMKGTRFFLLLA